MRVGVGVSFSTFLSLEPWIKNERDHDDPRETLPGSSAIRGAAKQQAGASPVTAAAIRIGSAAFVG